MHHRIIVKRNTPSGQAFFLQTSSLDKPEDILTAYDCLCEGFLPPVTSTDATYNAGLDQFSVSIIRQSTNTTPYQLTEEEFDGLELLAAPYLEPQHR